MLPYVTILGLNVGTYTLMAFCGGVSMVAYILITNHFGRCGNIPIKKLLFLICTSCFGLFFGATGLSLFSKFILATSTDAYYGYTVFEVLDASVGSAMIYGGLFGFIAAAMFCCKILEVPHRLFMGIYAPAQALLYTFGRLGCLGNGCCFGVPHSFGYTLATYDGINRFPTQAIEITVNVVLFVVLAVLARRWGEKNAYKTLPLYLFVYAFIRFFEEFMRADALRYLLTVSINQWISIAVIFLVLIWWLKQPSTDKMAKQTT